MTKCPLFFRRSWKLIRRELYFFNIFPPPLCTMVLSGPNDNWEFLFGKHCSWEQLERFHGKWALGGQNLNSWVQRTAKFYAFLKKPAEFRLQSGLFVYQIRLKAYRMPWSYHSMKSEKTLKIFI